MRLIDNVPQVVERTLDNLGNSRARQRAEIVFARVQQPSPLIITSVAPLWVQVQSDLKAIPVEVLDLPLNKIDGRVRAAGLYFLELGNLNECDESSVPIAENF